MAAHRESSSGYGWQGLERKSTQNHHPLTVVAIKELGPPHCPWMWRQISTLRSLELQIMYWMPTEAGAHRAQQRGHRHTPQPESLARRHKTARLTSPGQPLKDPG